VSGHAAGVLLVQIPIGFQRPPIGHVEGVVGSHRLFHSPRGRLNEDAGRQGTAPLHLIARGDSPADRIDCRHFARRHVAHQIDYFARIDQDDIIAGFGPHPMERPITRVTLF